MVTKLFMGVYLTINLMGYPIASIAEAETLLRFNPFRKPEFSQLQRSPVTGELSARAELWKSELRATMIAMENPMVNVDGLILAIGEEIQGYELVTVQERSAIFEKAGHRVELTMDEDEEIE